MRRLAAALVVLGGTALRQPPRRIAAEKTLRVLIADVGDCVGIKFQAPTPSSRRITGTRRRVDGLVAPEI